MAQATTRLARSAVLVQNSVPVGPSSSAERKPTASPKRTRLTGDTGTVLGSESMKKAKTSTSGEVTRIVHSRSPQIGAAAQLAVMQ